MKKTDVAEPRTEGLDHVGLLVNGLPGHGRVALYLVSRQHYERPPDSQGGSHLQLYHESYEKSMSCGPAGTIVMMTSQVPG
jgi:hypothetical protein